MISACLALAHFSHQPTVSLRQRRCNSHNEVASSWVDGKQLLEQALYYMQSALLTSISPSSSLGRLTIIVVLLA
jgi:hypothetical protein